MKKTKSLIKKLLAYIISFIIHDIKICKFLHGGKMRKSPIMIFSAATLVILNGCGDSGASEASKTTNGPAAVGTISRAVEQEKPLPLKLVESGYTIIENPYGGPFVEYGFVLNNPNSKTGANFPVVRITMRDANNQVIGTQEQTLMKIFPSETVGWGGQVSANGKTPAKIEFEPYVSDRNWNSMNPGSIKPFQITGLTVNGTDFNTTFTGELVNPNPASFDMVAVSVVLRDANNKIIAGYSGFVNNLAPNGKAPFQVISLGDVPQYTKYEAYATTWSTS
ncbi:MAG: FxLYD domain-containing protein [Thermoleophilia bacterium]